VAERPVGSGVAWPGWRGEWIATAVDRGARMIEWWPANRPALSSHPWAWVTNKLARAERSLMCQSASARRHSAAGWCGGSGVHTWPEGGAVGDRPPNTRAAEWLAEGRGQPGVGDRASGPRSVVPDAGQWIWRGGREVMGRGLMHREGRADAVPLARGRAGSGDAQGRRGRSARAGPTGMSNMRTSSAVTQHGIGLRGLSGVENREQRQTGPGRDERGQRKS